ncbi:MAG: hypothetical protein C0404_00430 [Verrucomicrobia bacterium]|nr:hypothetical protein [Verrucomicrobiota bacterium]
MTTIYRAATNNMLNQAILEVLAPPANREKKNYPRSEAPRTVNFMQLLQSDYPFLTALLFSLAERNASGLNRGPWQMYFRPLIASEQIRRDAIGWWSPDRIGNSVAPEFNDMNEKERAIYTTAMIVLTIQIRSIPVTTGSTAGEHGKLKVDIQM